MVPSKREKEDETHVTVIDIQALFCLPIIIFYFKKLPSVDMFPREL